MPKPTLHARLVDLFRARPSALLAALVRASRVSMELPDHDEVTLATEATSPTQETPLRADAVFLLRKAGQNVAVVIVEVQSKPDDDKRYVWPTYAAGGHRVYRCPAIVLVVTTSRRVERWASRLPSFTHPGTGLVPIVIGPSSLPRVVDAAAARAQPWLAILGVLAHAREPEAEQLVGPALAALGALPGVDGELGAFVCDMLGRAFEGAARKQWEEAMLKDYEIESPALRKILSETKAKGVALGEARGRVEGRIEGRVEGEARGRAEDVLAFLDARGIGVPAELAERVRACTDLEVLGRLVRRAAVIASADQLFADA
jgi:hypothetical protein